MKKFVVLAIMIFVVLSFQSCKGNESPKSSTMPKTSAAKVTTAKVSGTKQKEKPLAPDISMRNADGKKIKLSDFKGKVILLNFWGTWCPPCRGEMPDLDKVYKEYKDAGVLILAANVQGVSREVSVKGVKEWFAKKGYSMPLVFVEAKDASSMYGINAFPTSFFINPEGRVEFYQPGALKEEQMKKALEFILKAQGE